MLSEHMRIIAGPLTAILYMNPSLFKWLPGFSKTFEKILKNRDQLFGYFDAQILEHQNCLNVKTDIENYNPADFVEAYLLEIQKRKIRSEKSAKIQFEDKFYW